MRKKIQIGYNCFWENEGYSKIFIFIWRNYALVSDLYLKEDHR